MAFGLLFIILIYYYFGAIIIATGQAPFNIWGSRGPLVGRAGRGIGRHLPFALRQRIPDAIYRHSRILFCTTNFGPPPFLFCHY